MAGLQARAAAVRRLALIELGDHLRDVSTVKEMTATAAEIVGRIFNVSRAGYGELDDTGQLVTILQDWTTPGSDSLTGQHRLAGYGDVGPIMQRGETLVVSSMTEDPRTASHVAPFEAISISAMLNVPVRERGRTVGIFYVHSSTPRTWTEEEITFARNVADRVQIGIARLSVCPGRRDFC